MNSSDDILAGLPAPLDDEPPSVRQDIADELADHLACAYRRELLKTADEPMAQQRVLDRFGDPRRIAYQLWFQALWGRIMLHRFTRVWQGLKIVSGLVALFLIVRTAEQQSALHNQIVFMTSSYNAIQSQAAGTRNLLEQVLQRLPQPPQQPGYESGMGGAEGMAMPGSGAMMGMGGAPMMPGDDMGMMAGMMPGAIPAGAAAPAQNSVQPGLIVRLTMDGDDNKPASGCDIAVISEQGPPLELISPISVMGTGMPGAMGASSVMPVSSGGSPGGPYHAFLRSYSGVPAYRVAPEMNGVLRFRQNSAERPTSLIEPGRYTIVIEFPDGRQCAQRFTISPEQKAVAHVEHIRCPGAAGKAYVHIRTPKLPTELVDAGMSLQIHLHRMRSTSGAGAWYSTKLSNIWDIATESQSGIPWAYNDQYDSLLQPQEFLQPQEVPDIPGSLPSYRKNLKDLPDEDRFLIVPCGTYRAWLNWYRAGDWQREGRQLTLARSYPVKRVYPAAGAANDGILEITADTRDVLLDVPEGMLQAAREALSRESTKAAIETP